MFKRLMTQYAPDITFMENPWLRHSPQESIHSLDLPYVEAHNIYVKNSDYVIETDTVFPIPYLGICETSQPP